jgi:hypothetical protein
MDIKNIKFDPLFYVINVCHLRGRMQLEGIREESAEVEMQPCESFYTCIVVNNNGKLLFSLLSCQFWCIFGTHNEVPVTKLINNSRAPLHLAVCLST